MKRKTKTMLLGVALLTGISFASKSSSVLDFNGHESHPDPQSELKVAHESHPDPQSVLKVAHESHPDPQSVLKVAHESHPDPTSPKQYV